MFNLFAWLTKFRQGDKLKQERVLKLWAEIEECKKAYQNKKDIGDQLLAECEKIDNLQLPFAEKMVRKEKCLNAARDNLYWADVQNQKIADLSAELRLAIKDAGR